jgi:hypothetical protein
MEQLLLIAIFLLVGLINMIIRQLRQRAQAPGPPAEPAEPEDVSWPAPSRMPELPPAARVILPVPLAEPSVPAVRPMRPPAPAPPALRRRRDHRRLGSRADVRRAIVAMTVLGPCRAREHESEVRTSGPAQT